MLPRNVPTLAEFTERRLAYATYNLDYVGLDSRLNSVRRNLGRSRSLRRAVSSQSFAGETRTFAEILDQEVEKIVLFYIKEQGNIAAKVWELRARELQNLQDYTIGLDDIEALCQRYRDVGGDVLNLLDYLDNNVLKLRKLIQKHDSIYDQKLGFMYLDKSSKSAQLRPLYHQEGVQAIISTIRRGFEDLYEAHSAILNPVSLQMSPARTRRHSYARTVPKVTFGNRLLSAGNLMDLEQSSSSAMATRNKSTGSLLILDTRPREDSGPTPRERRISEAEPILEQISALANRVMQTQRKSTVEFLASTSKMALEMSLDDLRHTDSSSDLSVSLEGTKPKSRRTFESSSGLYINLFITFVYLANQYVVAPTSGEYARLLGMTPAMSGVIIGLTPAAALLSSFLYSMWSNYSFKRPILTCVVCGIAGNLLYGMALQCNAQWMILAGRLLTGFGGPRVISRRYIADHVPAVDRLLASSQFVTAGALGLSCGPLISSLVGRSGVDFSWEVGAEKWTLIRYQEETAPGWIMVALWLVALVAVVLLFQEPEAQYMRGNTKGSLSNSKPVGRPYGTGDTRYSYTPVVQYGADSGGVAMGDMSMRGVGSGSGDGSASRDPFLSGREPLPVGGSGGRVGGNGKARGSTGSLSSYGSIGGSKEVIYAEPGLDHYLLESAGAGAGTDAQPTQKNSISAENLERLGGRHYRGSPSVGSSSGETIVAMVEGGGFALQSPKQNPIQSYQHSNQQSPPQHQLYQQSKEGKEGKEGEVREETPLMGNGRGSDDMLMSLDEYSTLTARGDDDLKVMYQMMPIEEEEVEPFFTEYVTVEVMVILFLYLVNKMGQEMSVSSIPLITSSVFGWSQESAGYYMALVGALVLPVNIFVNSFVKDVEERDMVLRLTCCCVGGMLFVCNTYVLGEYTLLQYVLGTSLMFTCLNALEGIIMALLAKLISPELAKGTFNSGLLATEAGTLGRVVGDVLITVFGGTHSPEVLTNNLFLPLGVMLLLSLLLVLYYFDRLS
ncbi:major facilitator superfamily domain-containing protein [Ochromonadaceae sp. CCMP2298]|nr:major facilitator superfamily domain-containing protein [Ochromonadaceae sp. CCMP2298]|mmetsp:Transcript_33614/g.74088  ORF Transcript_33614/g.74088 Transcript_33614/m.74088 type:complete len:1011 (+) Transcript_33614:144-3176(+)